MPKAPRDILPGIIRVSAADNNLKVRRKFPQPSDGFDTVPPGRHADIDEGQRVRLLREDGFAEKFHPVAPLESGIDMK